MILNQYISLSYLFTTKQLVFNVCIYTRAVESCDDDDEEETRLSKVLTT
jgi:hypothetical protein